MNFLSLWHEGWTAPLVNHLWQSTAVVVIAWLLAAALRKNHARVRYWVWFAASVKFLLPFSLLITAGEWMRSLVPVPAAQPAVASVMEQVTQPFRQAQFFDVGSAPIAAHHASYWPLILFAIWLCGALAIAIRFGLAWAKMNAVKRRARPFALAADVPVLSSSEPIEPGIFGILRPVLLLPEGIPERLSAEQMRAIVTHEICHVRRRDNLTFAIHMVVETLFWFHPMVWWIGSRLIEERERACDEAAVQAGSQAQVYAEGILNVCKFYVETPLACVSGVTGADLKKRIARIMTNKVTRRLGLGRILLICATAALAVGLPVVLGITRVQAQAEYKDLKFEVVSIRPNKSGGQQIVSKTTPDSFEMRNMFLGAAILSAYVPRDGGARYYSDEQVIGMPHWLVSDQDRYDINAKVDPADLSEWQNPTKQPAMLRAMLQNMLADRLKLKVHRSTKEEAVYALVVGKKGPHFKESVPGASHPDAYPMPGGGKLSMETKDGWMTTHYFDVSIGQVISLLLPSPGRPIQDRTGLTGKYDITITKPVPAGAGTPEVKPVETSAAEIANQLGLKIERSVGKVETLVIDHVERPSPN